MIIDAHTHLFPPDLAQERERLVAQDPTFGALYGNPAARLASDAELLTSMDAAGIDMSVALGFAWRDAETCRRHNDYLVEAARRSEGRIVAFCTLPLGAGEEAIEGEMRRCVGAGVRGFGELRPDNLGFDLTGPAGDRLGELAEEMGCALLFHVSEPAGHAYPGKDGLALERFHTFVARHPDARVIGAHWGGGLPFYARMPEVKSLFGSGNLLVDTAASSLLYDPTVYTGVSELIGPGAIVFGSDFPLLGQKRSRERIEQSGLEEPAVRGILGDTIAAWLA